jgi:hypothetical protein
VANSLGSIPCIFQMFSLYTMKMPCRFIDFYGVFCKTINKEAIWQPLRRGYQVGEKEQILLGAFLVYFKCFY